jgi:hypothetical protein
MIAIDGVEIVMDSGRVVIQSLSMQSTFTTLKIYGL